MHKVVSRSSGISHSHQSPAINHAWLLKNPKDSRRIRSKLVLAVRLHLWVSLTDLRFDGSDAQTDYRLHLEDPYGFGTSFRSKSHFALIRGTFRQPPMGTDSLDFYEEMFLSKQNNSSNESDHKDFCCDELEITNGIKGIHGLIQKMLSKHSTIGIRCVSRRENDRFCV